MGTKNFPKNRYEKLIRKNIHTKKLSFGKEMLCVAHQKNPRKKFTRDIGSSSTEPGIRKKRLREKIAVRKNNHTENGYGKNNIETRCPNEFLKARAQARAQKLGPKPGSPGPSPSPSRAQARAQARIQGRAQAPAQAWAPNEPKPGPKPGPKPRPKPRPYPRGISGRETWPFD